MHRPYGSAGMLPWQSINLPIAEFGGGDVGTLANCASAIKTFTEGLEEGKQLQEIKNSVHSAGRIIFLGFSFHRQNVELMNVGSNDQARVLATAKDISDSDKSVIIQEIGKCIGIRGNRRSERIDLVNSYCKDFFEKYTRTITS